MAAETLHCIPSTYRQVGDLRIQRSAVDVRHSPVVVAASGAATNTSTTPLPLLPLIGSGIALGIGWGVARALLGGGSSASGLKAVARSIGISAAGGATLAGAALLIDRLTGNHMGSGLAWIVDHRHSIGMVVRHPTQPWIGPLGRRTFDDAERVQERLYHVHHATDDGGDAFRHAYASALFAVRMMRDHHVSADQARSIVIEAGDAHELDTWGSNTPAAHAMDLHNNAAGADLAGDGRGSDGAWLTDSQVQDRVLEALSRGVLVRLQPGSGELVPTSSADFPASAQHV